MFVVEAAKINMVAARCWSRRRPPRLPALAALSPKAPFVALPSLHSSSEFCRFVVLRERRLARLFWTRGERSACVRRRP